MTREEAINKIRKMILPKETMKLLQALAPELRESKDERIIKTLQEYVKNQNWPLNGPTQAEVLAWLKKQKERGPLTKEEEYTLHRIIEYLEDETCPSEWVSLLHDIYCLPYGKQKESLRDFIDNFPYSDEQKVDIDKEKLIRHCIGLILTDATDERFKDYGLTLKDCLTWLGEQKEQKPIDYVEELKKCKENPLYFYDNYVKIKMKEQKPTDLSEMMVHKEPYIAPVPTPMVANEQKPVKASGKLSRQDYLFQLLIDQLITYSDYEYLIEHKPEKQEQKPAHTAKEMWKEMRLEVYAQASGNRHEPNYSDDSTKMFSLCDIDEIFEKIGNSTVGSQPAEWSEEDERMLSRCVKSIESSKQFADSDTFKKAKDNEINWLENRIKSFRSNKQEWSEEDEELIDLAVEAVEDFYNGGIRSKIINLLKSIRPSWKPNEEQMRSLIDALRVSLSEPDMRIPYEPLSALYEQLKKLM